MEALPKGPYVQAAFFCNSLLREQDGTFSAIRIIDRITQTIVGPAAPDDLPPFPYELTIFVMLKAGDALGRKNFTLFMTGPDGVRHEVGSGSVHFQGGLSGVNIPINMKMMFQQEGPYWFDFVLEGQVLTRMPLDVQYSRARPGSVPP